MWGPGWVGVIRQVEGAVQGQTGKTCSDHKIIFWGTPPVLWKGLRVMNPKTSNHRFTFSRCTQTPPPQSHTLVKSPCLVANNKLNLSQHYTSLPNTDYDPGATQVF